MTGKKISAQTDGGTIQATDQLPVNRAGSPKRVVVGTAGTRAASDATKANVASISGAITSGHLAIFSDTNGTVQDGGAPAASATTDTTNAANISSGTLPAARLPNPSASTLGGVQSAAAVSHQFITSISTSGVPALAQPAASDISGLATSATTDTTNAANISSGTLPAARLPNPAASTLGGVNSKTAVSHNFLTAIGTDGSVTQAQPAASDLSNGTTGSGAVVLATGPTFVGSANVALTTSAGNIIIDPAYNLGWTSRGRITSPADSQINFQNNALTAGVGFDVSTDGTLKIRNTAQNADAALTVGSIKIIDNTAQKTGGGVLSAQNGGDTNNSSSGSGSDYAHSLTYTLPANYLTANKLLRVTAQFSWTTGAAAPTLIFKLKAGSTALYTQTTSSTPGNSITGANQVLTWTIQGTAAAGASAGTYTGLSFFNLGGVANSTAQPVNLATNGTLQLQVATQWGSAGTGTNTITLNQFIVEALN